jgi:hypothetical protein
VVRGDPCTEGSGTAKSGTDKQERHMRLMNEDKQAHLCNVLRFQNHLLVDAAGIGGRKKLLPGEVLTKVKKSAEVIVVTENEQTPEKKWVEV